MKTPPTFTPVTIASFPPPPPASSEPEKLTNENLLKSIGFIPEPSEEPEKSTSIDSDSPLISSSTEKLLQTFEVIGDPGQEMLPRPLASGGMADDPEDEDFVVVVPDCFDLSKPLPDYTPPTSLSCLSGSYDIPPESAEAVTASCDSHVTITMAPLTVNGDDGDIGDFEPVYFSKEAIVSTTTPPSNEGCEGDFEPVYFSKEAIVRTTTPSSNEGCKATPTSNKGCEGDFEPVYFSKEAIVRTTTPPPATEGCDQVPDDHTPKGAEPEGDTPTPATAHKSPSLAPRLTLRNLKGGLYKNPLAMATGLVNAVSGFVDDKVHFAPSAVVGGAKKPCVQFAESSEDESSEDEDEDFHVRE